MIDPTSPTNRYNSPPPVAAKEYPVTIDGKTLIFLSNPDTYISTLSLSTSLDSKAMKDIADQLEKDQENIIKENQEDNQANECE